MRSARRGLTSENGQSTIEQLILFAPETRTDLPAAVPRLRLEFTYDSLSRRIAKKVFAWGNGQWQMTRDLRFVYDGWNLQAEIDATGAPVRSYLWGLDLSGSLQGAGGIGGLLCVTQHSTPATRHLPSYDGNGNLVVLVCTIGDVRADDT